MTENSYRFSSVQKDPNESLPITLNLFKACANLWRANEPYDAGEFVRPRIANGFAYEITTAGLSAHREPIYPRVEGATVSSGSAVLTCRSAGNNGLSMISSPSATSDPSGLTISGVSVSESTKILATYSGGELGQDYDAVFTFTLNGVSRVARQTVKVRNR